MRSISQESQTRWEFTCNNWERFSLNGSEITWHSSDEITPVLVSTDSPLPEEITDKYLNSLI